MQQALHFVTPEQLEQAYQSLKGSSGAKKSSLSQSKLDDIPRGQTSAGS